jgi:Domain of unknown function (DUF4184)
MPFTFFAHQAPVIPLKIARPRWFDGTALCIGSMAPDFAYPLGAWMQRQNHTAIGIVVWSLPVSLVICWAIRTWVAETAFAQLPDAGWFRLHSYRVLATRRPPVLQTVVSVLLGATIHVLIDAFTHVDRFGALWLNFDSRMVTIPMRGETELARALQDAGHTFGTMLGIALLVYVGHGLLLERWYGTEAVARARRFTLLRSQRVVFWCVVALGLPFGVLWSLATEAYAIHRLIDAVAITTAVACALPVCRPRAVIRECR